MVGMFVLLCLASKKSSEREFFVPAGTHRCKAVSGRISATIGVKSSCRPLLSSHCPADPCRRLSHVAFVLPVAALPLAVVVPCHHRLILQSCRVMHTVKSTNAMY